MTGLLEKFPLTQLGAILLVLFLHAFINVVNRYICFLWDDEYDVISETDVFSCSLLVFILLLWLITFKRGCFDMYGVPIIQAELFLQLFHAFLLCRIFSLRLCDIIPLLENTTFGCINIFKTALVLGSVYFIVKTAMSFLDSGDDCGCSDSDCNSKKSALSSYLSQSPSMRSTPCYPRQQSYAQPRRPYSGRRVWLEIVDYSLEDVYDQNLLQEASLTLSLGAGTPTFRPYVNQALLSEGAYLSFGERLELRLRTGSSPTGRGFKANYKIVNAVEEERVVHLYNGTGMILRHLNFPAPPPGLPCVL
ncbi:hypothetical protein WDU94_014132 [Cyamophila willieti]